MGIVLTALEHAEDAGYFVCETCETFDEATEIAGDLRKEFPTDHYRVVFDETASEYVVMGRYDNHFEEGVA